MKYPTKSFGVFEFKAEDDPHVVKFRYPRTLDVSKKVIKTNKVGIGICGGSNADAHNCDAADSSASVEAEDFARGKSALNFLMASDADENMSEASPLTFPNTFCDGLSFDNYGPSSDNCFGGCNLGEKVGIVFHPDYIYYCGTQYMDTVVSFSEKFVEARSEFMFGNEKSFQIHLELEDIIKIESHWSARGEAGIITIYCISKDIVQGDFIHNASALQELKFPAVDSDWHQKLEAIVSLDTRYKAITEMEIISPFSEVEEMMPIRSYFPKFDKPFEEVIYPKGDPDAVSISKRDIDLLLPETFVNDTIIDFYIKYLKSKQNEDARSRFHFFNSFFFRKLADMDKDTSSTFDGKAAFQRVHKWTRKINLLEKDFIFIPVNYNYHWSLIVICYLGEVSRYKDIEDDKPLRVPCILHMDSLRGTHAGLKNILQSYLWEEWKERHKETSQDLHTSFRNLKFVPLELPQQPNSYDCGLFLLHYVELFLEEVPDNFNVYMITPSSKFLQKDWFPPAEASMKRTCIERVINDLVDTQSEDCSSDGSGVHGSPGLLNVTLGHADGVDFSLKSSPSASLEISPQPVDTRIEMTLLPASSTEVTYCNGASGVVIKKLFKQASGPESLNEFNMPGPSTEEANRCRVQQEFEEPIFHSVNDATLDSPLVPYSCEDFRLNPLEPVHSDVCLSQVKLGPESDAIAEVEADDKHWQSVPALGRNDEIDRHIKCSSPEKIEQSIICSEVSGDPPNAETPLKELCPKAKQVYDWGPSHDMLMGTSLAFGNNLDASGAVISCDEAGPLGSGHERVLESDDEGRARKKIRLAQQDGGEDNANNYLVV